MDGGGFNRGRFRGTSSVLGADKPRFMVPRLGQKACGWVDGPGVLTRIIIATFTRFGVTERGWWERTISSSQPLLSYNM